MHRRRLLVAVSASALILLGSLPFPAAAAGPDRVPQRLDMSKVDPVFHSRFADPTGKVTVMLELASRPAIGVAVTRQGQQAEAGRLRTAQKPVVAAVGRLGAKVVARYQYAYNGLRVRATYGQLAKLAAIPGVKGVHALPKYTIDNVNGVPAIGAPTAWGVAGATGAGTIVAVIDTGLDYTHANFGGPGTTDAYDANDPATIEAGTFPTPKVIAGYDFAGNDYDASGDNGSATPTPDADPLDCNGHGSHVAGTVAGKGVLADHSTFSGIYNQDTIGDPADWVIAPGVAPEAKLISLKIFGCEGSTDLTVDALEWVGAYNAAHAVGIDVVNMSLGSPFGEKTTPDTVASNALVASGVVVVASAGNESSVPYITGAPASASGAISVAALDANATLPMATIDNSGADIPGINQNNYPGLDITGDLFVLADDPGTAGTNEYLGCFPTDYPAGVAGKIVAVKRGVCAFVDKGANAEAAGAVGIIVINRNSAPGDVVPPDALPTFIGYNPEIFDIPMIGLPNTVAGSDPAVPMDLRIAGLAGESIHITSAGTQPNPAFDQITGFSSSGPRWGDSWLKPDVAAPGASVISTLSGGGWQGTTLSGTSMAAPMTSGAAALVVQAHPGWSALKVKAALVNTANGAAVVGYDPERAGSGLIAVNLAVDANVVATTGDGTSSLNYGYVRAGGAWTASKIITFWNDGPKAATYALAASSSLVKLSASTVNVPAGGSASVTATASLSAFAVRHLETVDQYQTGDFTGLFTLDGVVTATPSGSIAGQHSLRVPYLVVPRGISNVKPELGKVWTTSSGVTSGKILLDNPNGHAGWADVFALGFTDASGDGAHGTDVRAAGVQVNGADYLGVDDPADRAVVFAVTMHDRFSNASPHAIDVVIDTNGDGDPDRYVTMYDYGILSAGAYSGLMVSIVSDADFNIIDIWNADTPLNGSTVLLPALASKLGLSAGAGSFTYHVEAFDGFTGDADVTKSSKAFDAYAPTISTGNFRKVDVRSSTRVNAWFQRAAAPRGWLVVTLDDNNGAKQGDIVRVPKP